jgi:hypothetical protein
MPLPSKVEFVSFLQYSPRGTSDVERQSRVFRDAIKSDGVLTVRDSKGLRVVRGIELIVESLKAHSTGSVLGEVLGPHHMLIPIPRSAPLAKPDALWPSRRICDALAAVGLGREVAPLLVRYKAVQKSAFAGTGQRPVALDHFNSTKIDESALISTPDRITLIDDFVTRGATFVGMYPHVRQAFPNAKISCFALVRTMSFDPISKIIAPVKGLITKDRFGNTRRTP